MIRSIPTVQHPLPSEWDPRWKLPRHHHVPETKKGHEFTAALPMFAHGKCPKRGLVWMTPWLWDAKLLYFQVFNPKIPFQALADSHGKTMESILPASTTHHIVENIRILHRHPTAEDHTGNPRTLHAELHQPGKTSQREVRKVDIRFLGKNWTQLDHAKPRIHVSTI